MALVSTKVVQQRWRDVINALYTVRGHIYYVAPGTTTITIAGRSVTPRDTNDGLNLFTPLASCDELWDKITSGNGDCGVLIKEGAYALTANVASTKHSYCVMGFPGGAHRAIYIQGIDGGHALDLRGGNVHLKNLEVGGASDAHAALSMSGRYSTCWKCSITSKDYDTEVAAYGLRLAPIAHATGDKNDASFMEFIECEIDYVGRGVYFDPTTAGAPGSPTNNLFERCVFRKNTTHDFDGHVSAAIQGTRFYKNTHTTVPAGTGGNGKFMYLDKANAGNAELNMVEQCKFNKADVASPGDLQLTSGGFNIIGCIDGTGSFVQV